MFDKNDSASVQQAVLENESVPREVLEQYPDEPWAQEAIGNLPETKWYDEYGVTDEAWLSIVGRYDSRRDALDGLVKLQQMKSSAVSPPSKDLEPDEYSKKVSEMRRNVAGLEKPEDYVVNIPDDLKEEVLKRTETFEKDVKDKAFEYARTQAEVDADVNEAMTKLREVIAKEKETENTANAAKVRNRQELENIWGKRTDEEMENGRLVLRHYDNSLLFADNQSLYTEEVLAEKGGFLEQFFAENDHPMLRRLFSSLHSKVLAEGDFVDGTKTGVAGSMYKERYEKAKKAWPKRPEKFWEDIARVAWLYSKGLTMELRPTKLSINGKRIWLENDESGGVRRKLEYDVLEVNSRPLLVKKELIDDECVIVE